ncbi:serine/threonine-protein kinase [Bailinhaonella thermotolerans]|uniref:serine/threonine-protein kinase n=1 Tax=Bailinhaonella thermotolerans TaxID=1070861 RepID=UPI00192A68C1|nr:serine/threonine-protein kinase [Bailinhaonella thermotolerans]
MNAWSVPGYTELRELGMGGGGRVVLAVHDATGAEVAIKYLSRELTGDAVFLRRFREEAALLFELGGEPNVARLFEYVESAQGAAIVMELVHGAPLRRLIAREGRTGPEAALVVLKGSLLGLAAAHSFGVVHRDYKPENVLVGVDGSSKLVDFGIATWSGLPGVPAGTPPYMAPEQWDGAPQSPATDVYAATAVFYECVTGHRPYTATHRDVLRYQHQTAEIPVAEVPRPLRALVTRGLAKDPPDRPGSAAEFVRELEEIAVTAYGREWEDRGRRRLAELAAVLAVLLPAAAQQATGGTGLFKTILGKAGGAQSPLIVTTVVAATVLGAGAVLASGRTPEPAPAPVEPALAMSQARPASQAPPRDPLRPGPGPVGPSTVDPGETGEKGGTGGGGVPAPHGKPPVNPPGPQTLDFAGTVGWLEKSTPVDVTVFVRRTSGRPVTLKIAFTTGKGAGEAAHRTAREESARLSGAKSYDRRFTHDLGRLDCRTATHVGVRAWTEPASPGGAVFAAKKDPRCGRPAPGDPASVAVASWDGRTAGIGVTAPDKGEAGLSVEFTRREEGGQPVVVKSATERLSGATRYTRSHTHAFPPEKCGARVLLGVQATVTHGDDRDTAFKEVPAPAAPGCARLEIASWDGSAVTARVTAADAAPVRLSAAFTARGGEGQVTEPVRQSTWLRGATAYTHTFRQAFPPVPCGQVVTRTVELATSNGGTARRETEVKGPECPPSVDLLKITRWDGENARVLIGTSSPGPVALTLTFAEGERPVVAHRRTLTLKGSTEYTRTVSYDFGRGECGQARRLTVMAATVPSPTGGTSPSRSVVREAVPCPPKVLGLAVGHWNGAGATYRVSADGPGPVTLHARFTAIGPTGEVVARRTRTVPLKGSTAYGGSLAVQLPRPCGGVLRMTASTAPAAATGEVTREVRLPKCAPKPDDKPKPDDSPKPKPDDSPKPKPDDGPKPKPGDSPKPEDKPKPKPEPKPEDSAKPKPGEGSGPSSGGATAGTAGRSAPAPR